MWLDARKVIYFCGAGISQFIPSNLPTGEQLLTACYKDIEDQYNTIGLNKMDLVDFKRLPLETIIGLIVEDMPNEKYIENISLIKNYFQGTKPNNIHLLISSFLCYCKNRYLITTNYDDGFENALKLLPKYEVIRVYGAEKIKSIEDKINSNCIFKIHGCAVQDNPNNIVLTTQQESLGLSSSFVNVMKSLFTESLVVFCGHSISEPDCLEALTEVSNFNVIWIDRDRETYEKNFRAKYITQQAREAYFLEDLHPFNESEEMWDVLRSFFKDKALNNIRVGYCETPLNYKNKGIELFKNLSKGLSKEELYRILICGYLLLREYEKVQLLLSGYRKIDEYHEYNYLFWKASIIRDQNNNYETALDYFNEAVQIECILPYEKVSAQVEKLGLASVISQGNLSTLKSIANELDSLVIFIENHVKLVNTHEKEDYLLWLGLLGRAQKNIVQNLIYQNPNDIKILKRALDFCDIAITNLTESQEMHARVETLRFKAVVHTSIYLLTENVDELDKALFLLNKTLMLFIMLGSDMGEINTRRHFIRVLIMYGKYKEAEKEIEILKKRMINSPDMLSQIKTIALEAILFYHTKRWVNMILSIFIFTKKARYISESNNDLQNMMKAFKWLYYWKKFY